MIHSFPEEKRKIRKPHRCHACEEKIIPGPNIFMNYWAGITDGDFWSCYMCEICEAFYKKYRQRFPYDEEFYEGIFKGDEFYEQYKKNW